MVTKIKCNPPNQSQIALVAILFIYPQRFEIIEEKLGKQRIISKNIALTKNMLPTVYIWFI